MNAGRVRVDVPGGTLAVVRAGAGPAVVLLHGLGLQGSIWDDVAAELSRHHLVLVPDLRGHGASGPADAPYAHSEDLACVLDRLGVAAADVVGSSLGGEVAIDFALAHPARVRSLVLVSPALGGHAWSEAWKDSIRAVRTAAKSGGPDAAREAWFAHPLFAPARADARANARLRAAAFADSGRRWSERDPARAPDPPASARLGELGMPVTVLVGADDLPDFHAIACAIASGVPQARVRTTAGGHLPMLEHPARLAAELEAILAQGPAAA